MSKTFAQFLQEAPLGDYETVGNFDKNSSFRHETDRKLVTSPKMQDKLRQKFENTHYTYNMYFVNSPAANRHTEVGLVDMDWVREELGDDVADRVEPHYQEDYAVNVIFTNNKGSERIAMTPWIIAHRIAHAMARYDNKWNGGNMQRQFYNYTLAEEQLIEQFSDIMKYGYGRTIPRNPRGIMNNRDAQLMMKHFFHNVCTFRSARSGKIRDWFEVLHELFAQHVTTKEGVKFNTLPESFKAGRGNVVRTEKDDGEWSDTNDMLNSLANAMGYYFDEMMGEAEKGILVM